jgi:hypothetical protein
LFARELDRDSDGERGIERMDGAWRRLFRRCIALAWWFGFGRCTGWTGERGGGAEAEEVRNRND